MRCPCGCGCADTCRCIANHCTCTQLGPDVWHTPTITLRDKRSVGRWDAYYPMWSGGCSCGWACPTVETESRAWTSANQHCLAKNRQLMEEVNHGPQPPPQVERLPSVQAVQVQGRRPSRPDAVANETAPRETAPPVEG